MTDVQDPHKTRIKTQWQSRPRADLALKTIYMQTGKIRSDLNNPETRPFLESTFSKTMHNDLIQQAYIIIDLLKALPGSEKSDSNIALNNLPDLINETETTLKELEKEPKEKGLLDKLDFILSQMESLIFGLLEDTEPRLKNNNKPSLSVPHA